MRMMKSDKGFGYITVDLTIEQAVRLADMLQFESGIKEICLMGDLRRAIREERTKVASHIIRELAALE